MTLSFVAFDRNMICSAELCNPVAMGNPFDTAADRLRWAREKRFTNAADFAAKIGVKPVTYRAYESGQNKFAKLAPAFAKALGVSTDWLLEGVGDPVEGDGQNATGPSREVFSVADLAAAIMDAPRVLLRAPANEADALVIAEHLYATASFLASRPDLAADQSKRRAALDGYLAGRGAH